MNYTVAPGDLPPDDVSLVDLLQVDSAGGDHFVNSTTYRSFWPLFGGQVAAQALIAADHTVPDGFVPVSLQSAFLRAGSSENPCRFEVDRVRDGRTLSSRRVTAWQGERMVLAASATFASADESAADVQLLAMPAVEPPGAGHRAPVVIEAEQSVPRQDHPLHRYPTRSWLRTTAGLDNSPVMQAAVVAYMSDLSTGHEAMADAGQHIMSSLDHTVWFHRPCGVNEWILYDLTSRGTSRGRAFYTGAMWSPDGDLVASMAQETLYRLAR